MSRIQKLAILSLTALCTSGLNAGYLDDIGLTDLRAREPSLDGTGVSVGQVEAQLSGKWHTDPSNVGLSSSTFKYYDSTYTYSTGTSYDSALESSHANTVGGRFFADPSGTDNKDGVASGVSAIGVFEANYFYNNLVASGTNVNLEVINQSFVFDQIYSQADQAYDNYADNYNVLFVNGINTNNNPATIPTPASSYNGIAVGAVNDPVASLSDGRSKPDIVAPGSTAASYTTPLVSGAAALLIQSGNTNDATDIRTIKALLLNSATKPKGWSNATTRPLDTTNGAGILEVNQAELQLAAGQYAPTQDEVLTEADTAHLPPNGETGNVASYSGWNLGSVTNTADSSGPPGGRKQYDVTDHYFFDLSSSDAAAFYLTSTLVWNRQSGRSNINNLDLFLYAEDGTLVASSVSSVDNVEHIYQRHIAPGRYILQVHKPYNSGNETNGETYALAFNFRAAPTPGTPGSLSATVQSSSEIDLSWTDTSDDETNYRVERRPSGGTYSTIDTLDADTTTYSDNGLDSGTTYEYRVTAFNAEAESSTTASATTLAALPDAPSNASANAVSTTAVNLSWSDNSNNEDGFRIERRPSGGSYAEIATVTANTTSYSDTSLSDGILFEYRVSAYNGSGSSTGTTTSATTPIAPASNAGATVISDTEVQISWTDNSTSETGYRIERRLSGGSYSTLTTLAADTEVYTDSTCTAGTSYDYQIIATNDNGDASAAQVSATTYTVEEDWLLINFGTTTATGDAADDADPEFDGLANQLEFATGSDPNAFSPNPVNHSQLGSTGKFSFTWRTNSALDFSIGYSNDLTTGFTYYSSSAIDGGSSPTLELIQSTPIDSEFETLTYGIKSSVTSDRVFIRLQINEPPE